MKRTCHIKRFAPLRFSNGSDFTLLAGTPDYTYDGNGNMMLDALRNITLTYDINNLVSTISRNDTLLSTYHYLADGTKYKVMDPDNNGRVYIGPFSYTTAKSGNTVYSYLEGIDTDGGRIMIVRKQSGTQNGTQNTYDYTTAFFVRDHLGSTRVMLNAQGNILERNAYYPFGLQTTMGKAYPSISTSLSTLYPNMQTSIPARRDLYNGKELQTVAGTTYIDYGFRQYDPVTARWMAVDPKAEKFLFSSSYQYCSGNPITEIDFMGLEYGDYVNLNMEKIGSDGIKDGKVYLVTKRSDRIFIKNNKDNTIKVSEVKSAIELPATIIRQEMGEAVKRSNSKNNDLNNEFKGDDDEGGLHEEGGIYGVDADGNPSFVPSKPGAKATESSTKATVDVENHATKNIIVRHGSYHVHPKGNSKISFSQKPTKPDDFNLAKNYKSFSYVLGAGNKTVTLFKGDGTKYTITDLDKFVEYVAE